MEDYATCIPELLRLQGHAVSYYGGFDGHEGGLAAAFAVHNLHKYIAANLALAKLDCGGNGRRAMEAAVHTSFAEANHKFLQQAREQSLSDGTTAVIALSIGSDLLVAHVGDSRAILCTVNSSGPHNLTDPEAPAVAQSGKDGDSASAAVLLTEDHQPGLEGERQRILSSGGTVEGGNGRRWRLQGELAVSRSLGDLPYIDKGLTAEPTLSPWFSLNASAYPGSVAPEFLILASDGLFEALQAEEVCNAAHKLASGQKVQKTPPAADALPFSAASDSFVAVAPQRQDRPHVSARIAGDPLEQQLTDLSPAAASAAEPAIEVTMAQRIADWLAEEAYNSRSMDNIAVVVVDVRPPGAVERSEPASTEVEILSSSEPDGVSVGHIVSSKGHVYRLHQHITQLPQLQHAHSTAPDQVVIRPGDTVERSWGHAMPWADVCRAEAAATDFDGTHRLLALEPASSDLVTKLARVPLLPAVAGLLGPAAEPVEGPGQVSEERLRRSGWEAGDLAQHWQLTGQLGQGSFGDVWHATRLDDGHRAAGAQAEGSSDTAGFVLKRMRLGQQDSRHLAYLRESYFGEAVNKLLPRTSTLEDTASDTDGRQHLVRFVEAFEAGLDYWLVFRDEGTSLHNLIYSAADADNLEDEPVQGVMLQASQWWRGLRRSGQGDEVIRDLLRQLLLALDALHHANITHRDVKPENLLVQQLPGSDGQDPGSGARFHLRLIDLGSAVDPVSVRELFGPTGPSNEEHTLEYAPPEALLGRYWTGKPALVRATWPYDMWSVGVTWLELILATPHVFAISERQRILLEQALHLDKQPQEERELAFWLRGIMQLCIYPPIPDSRRASTREGEASGKQGKGVPVVWSCAEEAVLEAIRHKDPLGKGLPSPIALRLLQRLLHWNPASRPTARQALLHAFFTVPLAEQHDVTCGSNLDASGWC